MYFLASIGGDRPCQKISKIFDSTGSIADATMNNLPYMYSVICILLVNWVFFSKICRSGPAGRGLNLRPIDEESRALPTKLSATGKHQRKDLKKIITTYGQISANVIRLQKDYKIMKINCMISSSLDGF